eukprot:GHVO01019142.1.p1 GENE.GHVO01019142.1~~GHVO01019142.1.p1  ORF type:complete len:101 (-),score=10.56 GHVO01019142.1:169-471(-)
MQCTSAYAILYGHVQCERHQWKKAQRKTPTQATRTAFTAHALYAKGSSMSDICAFSCFSIDARSSVVSLLPASTPQIQLSKWRHLLGLSDVDSAAIHGYG